MIIIGQVSYCVYLLAFIYMYIYIFLDYVLNEIYMIMSQSNM